MAHFLKEGGFKGELELVPKGEREPFTGVVRSQYSLRRISTSSIAASSSSSPNEAVP